MFCRDCEYDLAGARSGRCPECGRAFDPRDRRTYLRSLAWRRCRRWVCIAGALVVLYAIAPRGYVRCVAALSPGGGASQQTITQWRLAPPRWISAAPYSRWTTTEPSGKLATNGGAASDTVPACDFRLERVRWFQPPRVVATVSLRHAGLTPDRARAILDLLVRRQCQGYTGVWISLDDDTMPAYMRTEKDPW